MLLTLTLRGLLLLVLPGPPALGGVKQTVSHRCSGRQRSLAPAAPYRLGFGGTDHLSCVTRGWGKRVAPWGTSEPQFLHFSLLENSPATLSRPCWGAICSSGSAPVAGGVSEAEGRCTPQAVSASAAATPLHTHSRRAAARAAGPSDPSPWPLPPPLQAEADAAEGDARRLWGWHLPGDRDHPHGDAEDPAAGRGPHR